MPCMGKRSHPGRSGYPQPLIDEAMCRLKKGERAVDVATALEIGRSKVFELKKLLRLMEEEQGPRSELAGGL